MKKFIFHCKKAMENDAKLKVDFIALDLCPTYISFVNECGIHLSKGKESFCTEHPNDSNRKIFFKPDDVHNLKNLTNGLRNHRVICSDASGKIQTEVDLIEDIDGVKKSFKVLGFEISLLLLFTNVLVV